MFAFKNIGVLPFEQGRGGKGLFPPNYFGNDCESSKCLFCILLGGEFCSKADLKLLS